MYMVLTKRGILSFAALWPDDLLFGLVWWDKIRLEKFIVHDFYDASDIENTAVVRILTNQILLGYITLSQNFAVVFYFQS